MSKELEALERIRQETIPATYNQDFDKEECCKIIEDALKRLKQIEINQTIFENNPITVGKKIMALEIIKEKRVDVVYLISACYDLEDYNDYPPFEISEKDKLTQEQFDLLREVLL